MTDQTTNDLAAMAADLPVPATPTVATPEGDKGPVGTAIADAAVATEGTLTGGPAAANDAPSTSGVPDPAVVAVTETKVYSDGSSATGPGPLPEQSPEQQDAAAAALAQAEAAALATPMLVGSSVQPPTFTFENEQWKATYSLGEIVARAATEGGYSAEQWNSLEQVDREALIAKQVTKIKSIVQNGENVQRPDGLHNTIKELEVAKALTEIQPHEAMSEPVHHEGAVQRFMDEVMGVGGAIERRLMAIVADSEGKLRKLHIPFVD